MCWGRSAGDKCITQGSSFLSCLEHGDVILADRGFDDLHIYGAKLEIPAFTTGKMQLGLSQWITRKESHKFTFMWNVLLGF